MPSAVASKLIIMAMSHWICFLLIFKMLPRLNISLLAWIILDLDSNHRGERDHLETCRIFPPKKCLFLGNHRSSIRAFFLRYFPIINEWPFLSGFPCQLCWNCQMSCSTPCGSSSDMISSHLWPMGSIQRLCLLIQQISALTLAHGRGNLVFVSKST